MTNRQTYRLFGFPIWSIEYDFEQEPEHTSNTSGEYDIADYDDEETVQGFGFGAVE